MKPHVLYVYDPTTEEVVGALPSGDYPPTHQPTNPHEREHHDH